MKCVVGIDLGSTTTKAVLLDLEGNIVGRGITNSRSNYAVACAVAREEGLTSARFQLLERALEAEGARDASSVHELREGFRLELYLDRLADLQKQVDLVLERMPTFRASLEPAAHKVLAEMLEGASGMFGGDAGRRSDFFRDIAGSAFITAAERIAEEEQVSFERLVGLFDRSILDVETQPSSRDSADLLGRALQRVATGSADAERLQQAMERALATDIEEVSFVGTGYGRQTLPFPKDCVKSEILCHGRGAHRVFPKTRTVLDIGGQDTKAIQVDEHGVVTSFQMNDRCAAGCGRYLGYIADELNLGLHELGPLALKAKKVVRVNSTCTVFAGAELRERLALGQAREDILAGLHRAIMLRAMSLLARSGGVSDQFTFTGGVCNNPMATQILGELLHENYGAEITLNADPDSIYMGALGGAMFALDAWKKGTPGLLPDFVPSEHEVQGPPPACAGCSVGACPDAS